MGTTGGCFDFLVGLLKNYFVRLILLVYWSIYSFSQQDFGVDREILLPPRRFAQMFGISGRRHIKLEVRAQSHLKLLERTIRPTLVIIAMK